jgi:DNA-binding NtrC family response regulator
MDLLCKYHWPGNVRELKNLIQRTVVMATSEVLQPEHFMNGFFKDNSTQDRFAGEKQVPGFDSHTYPASPVAIEDVERDLILHTLESTGGNKTKAAEILKVTTRTLRNKLNKYSNDSASLQIVGEKIT